VLAFEVAQAAIEENDKAFPGKIAKLYTQRFAAILYASKTDHRGPEAERQLTALAFLQSAVRMYVATKSTTDWADVMRMLGSRLLSTAVAAAQIAALAAASRIREDAGREGSAVTSVEGLLERCLQNTEEGYPHEPHLVWLVTWLRAVCLPTVPESSAGSPHAAAGAPVGLSRPSPAGKSATKRKRAEVQDADSFDFFEEGDSDGDAAADSGARNGDRAGGGKTKRLKKRNASSPGTSSVVKAHSTVSASSGKAVEFVRSLLEEQLMVLVEHDLIGSALLVLASNLHHAQDAAVATEEALAAAVHVCSCATLLSSMAASPLPLCVVTALSNILGKTRWKIMPSISVWA
jgi:hypothetical protein